MGSEGREPPPALDKIGHGYRNTLVHSTSPQLYRRPETSELSPEQQAVVDRTLALLDAACKLPIAHGLIREFTDL